MGKYGVYCIAILLSVASVSFGRPSGIDKKEKLSVYRQEVELLRKVRPCKARELEVKVDLEEFGDIKGDPHYIPDCEEEGIRWKSAQCDHHDTGACFCVDEETGEIRNETRNERLHKEALKCGRIGYGEHADHICLHMRSEFDNLQKTYGLQGHSPLEYYPECTKEGKFKPLQRNEMSEFFCVDTDTGKIIPDTKRIADATPPLAPYVCEVYDKVWQDFKKWNSTEEKSLEKSVTKESCGKEFTFTECGCPKVCTSDSKSGEQEECTCKPACLCPEGKWELDGKCVSLEECHEAKPKSNVPFSDMLNSLTAGKFTKWEQYRKLNPNKILETFNAVGIPMEEMMSGSQGIALDFNPFARALLVVEPPVEENPQGGVGEQQNETDSTEETSGEGEYRGGERVPVDGEDTPLFLQLLKTSMKPSEVEDIVESGTRPVPTTIPPEELPKTEFDPSVEEYNTKSTGEVSSEESTQVKSPEVYYYNYEYLQNQSNTSNYYYEGYIVETVTTEMKEAINENEHEETTASSEYEPEETESTTPVELETEEVPETSRSTLPPEEIPEWVTERTEEEPEEVEEEEEGVNRIGVSPDQEETNPDQEIGRQKKVTSVPPPSHDEQQSHSSKPPCEESENNDETSASPTEEGRRLLDKILAQNKIIISLKDESPSVKKSIC